MIDDNKKVGILLMCIGMGSYVLGTILFFDRSLYLIANLCFLGGLYFLVGLWGALNFFRKKGKIKGSLFFFAGFMSLIVIRWGIIGFILQMYGLFVLFKSFFPFLYESACNLPIIGQYIRNSEFLKALIDRVSSKKRLPV